jgi:hypothetical protein
MPGWGQSARPMILRGPLSPMRARTRKVIGLGLGLSATGSIPRPDRLPKMGEGVLGEGGRPA